MHPLHHVISYRFYFFSSFFLRSFLYQSSPLFLFFLAVGEGSFSAIPIAIEESAHIVDPPVVPQTPDNASFELVPSLAFFKEQKETVKMLLHGIIHTLTSGNLLRLAYYRRTANYVFSRDWVPLDITPLRQSSMSFLLIWKA